MSTLRLLTAGFLVMTLSAGVRAEAKADTNKEKIVGAWEVMKSGEGAPAVGAVLDFTKDGKMKITTKRDDKEMTLEGTYTLEGDKLNVVLKRGDQENKHTVTIKKLTATEFVAENERGVTIECKRKK